MQRQRLCARQDHLEESESETDSVTESMRCISCKEEYGRSDAGTCKECYEEASETEEELKREIDDLKAKVAFLRFWPPTDHHHDLSGRSHGTGFTDVVLVAVEDGPCGGPSMPVPAHKAILVSIAFVRFKDIVADFCLIYILGFSLFLPMISV